MVPKKPRLTGVRPYATSFLVFFVYLATVPYLVRLTVPCMSYHPDASYSFTDCSATMILDRFIILAILGLAVTVIITFIFIRPKQLVRTAMIAVLLAILTVTGYYIYVPVAVATAKNAPILLETLRK